MLESYRQHVAERATLGIPSLPLSSQQTSDLCELLENPPTGEEEYPLSLLRDRVPLGIDQAAHVKTEFSSAISKGGATSPLVSAKDALELLGTMMGGYNAHSLIDLLKVSGETNTDDLSPAPHATSVFLSIGENIPFVLATKSSTEDLDTLPIECNVAQMEIGEIIDKFDAISFAFALQSDVIPTKVRVERNTLKTWMNYTKNRSPPEPKRIW